VNSFCELGDEYMGSIKIGTGCDWLNKNHFLKKALYHIVVYCNSLLVSELFLIHIF
jgi:hypothetical protein